MLPTFFLAWIRKNSFDFPKDLSEAIEAHAGALIDWKKQYDEMLTLYEAHKGDWEKFVNDWRDLANRVIKERDSALEALDAERQLVKEATQDKPLGKRERESMLKMIAAMAIGGYAFDPAAQRSETVKEIVSDLERQGVSLSDDTVRRYLTEAIEHLKDATS